MMNMDEFEKQLERQPLRKPPATWREEILASARVEIRGGEATGVLGWLGDARALLARMPVAWSAVAAIWLVIIGVNSLLSGPLEPAVAKTSAPAPHNELTVWNLRRMEMSLLANGPGSLPELAPPRSSPAAPPRPRSDRRSADGFGELNCEDVLAGMV